MIFREKERTCAVTFPEDFIQNRWEREKGDALDNGEKSHHLSIYSWIIKVWRDYSQLGWSDGDGRIFQSELYRQDSTVGLFAFGLYIIVISIEFIYPEYTAYMQIRLVILR